MNRAKPSSKLVYCPPIFRKWWGNFSFFIIHYCNPPRSKTSQWKDQITIVGQQVIWDDLIIEIKIRRLFRHTVGSYGTMDRFIQNRPWLSLIDFSDVKGQKTDKIMKKNNEKNLQLTKVHAGGDSKLICYLAWPRFVSWDFSKHMRQFFIFHYSLFSIYRHTWVWCYPGSIFF